MAALFGHVWHSMWLLIFTVLAVGIWALVDILEDIYWSHESDSAYGAARWARWRDIQRFGLVGLNGIILGRMNKRLLRLRSDKHVLTIAPNRAGKGVSSLIPNLLTWPGSMVVIDPKGENTAITARCRREMGQAVHVIDPWGITGMRAARLNPIQWLNVHDADPVEDVMLLADSLVASSDAPDDAFWTGEAKALISGLILHIVTTEPRERQHLGTLREFLTLGENEFDWLIDDMRNNQEAYGLVARSADRLMQKAKRERSGVISSAQAHTHILDSPRMVSAMARSDFDLAGLKRGGTTVYLVIPPERLGTHSRWLRLMVSLCLAALTKSRVPPPQPVMFMLDEFASLGRVLLEIAPGVIQNGMFNMEALLAQLYPPLGNGYPPVNNRAISLALAEAMSWLKSQGLLVRDPGQPATWYVFTRRAQSLQTRADVEAYRNGRILPVELLQPALAEKVWPLFLRGDHDVAVFQAFKDIEVLVRRTANTKGAGYTDDLVGVTLMRKAFHPETGPLTDKALVPAERQAEMELFAGAIGHAKNPPSHRDVNLPPAQAARLIVFASHLLSIVEQR